MPKKKNQIQEAIEQNKDLDLSTVDTKVESKKSEDTEKEVKPSKEKSLKTTVKSKKFAKAKKIRSYNYKKAKKALIKNKSFEIIEAVKLVKANSYAKFTESIELHINLGVDPKNSDQRIRFTTILPHGIGKLVKILIITDKEFKSDASNILVKNKDAITDILNGKLSPNKDFDIVMTTPSLMKDLAKIAKILGPKGMMPSLKNNTITENLAKIAAEFSKGQVEIKSQSGHAVIHQLVGNTKFESEQIAENIDLLIKELNRNTPAKLKKKLIQRVFIKSTMSPTLVVHV